jgi:putative MATE family efflux protein
LKQLPAHTGHGDITRRLFTLAWPIIGLNVLQVLALAVDTAMVGRIPNAEAALTGMGYAAQLIFLLMVAMIGLTVSTVAFIARAKGGDRLEHARHILHQSVQLTIVLGIVIAIVGNVLAVPMLEALGADETTLQPALDYFRPLLVGTAFNYLNILFAAALRGVGNTRLAFFVAVALNGLNVLFNYGLILGNFGLPALGNTGAAIGTVASQACAVVIMVVLLQRRAVPELYLARRIAAVDRKLVRDLLRVGWPAAADMLVLNAAFLSIVGMLSRIDQTTVAAHSIGLRVQALAFVPGMSVSQAIGAMVGQALGAHDVLAAKRVLRSGAFLSAGIMSTLGIILIVLADPIVGVFGVDPASSLHEYSVQWMDLLGYSMPIVGIYIAFTGLLNGAGATMVSLRINAATTFVAQIPASYVLGFVVGLGAWGVWVAFPLTFGAKALWALIEYRREKWARVGSEA